LKDAEDLTDLGNIIGYKAKAISYIAYHVDADKNIKFSLFPKKMAMREPLKPLNLS